MLESGAHRRCRFEDTAGIPTNRRHPASAIGPEKVALPFRIAGRVSRWQDRRPLPDVIIVKTIRETDPDAKRKLILAACCGTHGVQDGLTASIYVLLPVLAQTFGLGYAQVGLLRAVHGGAMWVLELPSGMLSERFGQRGLLAFGLLCGGAGYLAMSTAGGFHGVLLGLGIVGCGAAFQHSSARRW